MRRSIALMAATLAVGLLTVTTVKRLQVRSQELGRKPFTATVIERRYSPQGIEGYSEYLIHAVRSDGSEVDQFRRHKPDGQWGLIKTVVDLQRKSRVSVDPATESVTTYPLSREAEARFRMPASACTSDPNAPESSLLGYKVIRVQEDIGPALPVQADRWVAPKLNCFALRETSTMKSDAVSGYRIEREALFITEGEPPPTLFEIPSSYVERAPSEVVVELARRFPGLKAMSAWSASALDQVYQGAQRNR